MSRPRDPIIAVGLLTRSDLNMLGDGFRRAYPVSEDTDFSELLKAIDRADADSLPKPDR